jgi:hypothetical protein
MAWSLLKICEDIAWTKHTLYHQIRVNSKLGVWEQMTEVDSSFQHKNCSFRNNEVREFSEERITIDRKKVVVTCARTGPMYRRASTCVRVCSYTSVLTELIIDGISDRMYAIKYEGSLWFRLIPIECITCSRRFSSKTSFTYLQTADKRRALICIIDHKLHIAKT